MRKAVYAGSFDPITNGHIDVVRGSLRVFDKVVVAVAHNPRKDTATFSVAARVGMIRDALLSFGDRVEVDTLEGLLVDYCIRIDAIAIIRGLRAVSDFEYEFQMAMMNRHLNPNIETFFMMASEAHFYTASRLVKEVSALGGDVSALVPEVVNKRLIEKLAPGAA